MFIETRTTETQTNTIKNTLTNTVKILDLNTNIFLQNRTLHIGVRKRLCREPKIVGLRIFFVQIKFNVKFNAQPKFNFNTEIVIRYIMIFFRKSHYKISILTVVYAELDVFKGEDTDFFIYTVIIMQFSNTVWIVLALKLENTLNFRVY